MQQPGVSDLGVERDDAGHYVLAIPLDATQPNASAAVSDTIEGGKVARCFSGPFTKQ